MSLESSIREIIEEQVKKTVKPLLDRQSSENYSLQTRVDWTEKKLTETLDRLKTRNNDLFDNEVSGDKIDGGTITTFSSTGIKDEANSTKLLINDEKITVEKDLYVKGQINCDTLYYQGAVATDIDLTKSVRIDGNEVLWKDRLGNSVKSSRLTEVGVLNTLNVADTLTVEGGKVGINSLVPGGVLGVVKDGLEVIIMTIVDPDGTITTIEIPIGIGQISGG